MHNFYIVARKLNSNSHDKQKCKMIKTLVFQLIHTSQLYKPDLEKDSVHYYNNHFQSCVTHNTIHELLPQPAHLNYELGIVIKYNYNI